MADPAAHGETQTQKSLRAQIMEIQARTDLPAGEKARAIQQLMSQSFQGSSLRSSLPSSDEEHAISYHKRKQESEPNSKDILGCKHYERGCKVKAECCEKFFGCRRCHDETVSSHHIDRYAIREMLCMHCDTVQPIGQVCQNKECGMCMASYYCDVCKFHDDSGRSVFHCDDCKLCRVGEGLGIDFFHCHECGHDMAIGLKDNHTHIENNLKSNCPICSEFLFTSTRGVSIMPCGHAIHLHCYRKLSRTSISCPLCNKTFLPDETAKAHWAQMDQARKAQPMPTLYAKAKTRTLCNDCGWKGISDYHYFGISCGECTSFNTVILESIDFPTMEEVRALATTLPEHFSSTSTEEAGDGAAEEHEASDGESDDGMDEDAESDDDESDDDERGSETDVPMPEVQ
mmetsp:Transcript_45960/g.115708  ORF Transcript_45960/g.115708 Transcript_45960/m.115708 type:complete len:401 (-) Transcript_45960:313-1515(-)